MFWNGLLVELGSDGNPITRTLDAKFRLRWCLLIWCIPVLAELSRGTLILIGTVQHNRPRSCKPVLWLPHSL